MENDAQRGGAVPGEAPFKAALEHFSQLLRTLLAPAPPGSPIHDEGFVGPRVVAEIERWLREGAPIWGAWWGEASHFRSAGGAPFGQSLGQSFTQSCGQSLGLPPAWVAMDKRVGADPKHPLELMTRLFNAQVQMAVLWNSIARVACERFVARVGASRPGPDMQSIRRLYDLLIDCAEQAYAEIAYTDDYGRIQAELINLTAELSLDQRRRAESLAEAVGLPTRSEIDALRSELAQVRSAMGAELAQMRSQRQSAPRSGPETRSEVRSEPKSAAPSEAPSAGSSEVGPEARSETVPASRVCRNRARAKTRRKTGAGG